MRSTISCGANAGNCALRIAATPEPILARLAAALDATMKDPVWQAEADRLFQPLRRMEREEYRRHVFQAAADLRRLWQERPWRD